MLSPRALPPMLSPRAWSPMLSPCAGPPPVELPSHDEAHDEEAACPAARGQVHCDLCEQPGSLGDVTRDAYEKRMELLANPHSCCSGTIKNF